MLRKHINSLDNEELEKVPFQSWNCLTLTLSHRDIDLVIKDDKDMDRLLKFLIYKMQTIDGNKGSSVKILEVLNKQRIKILRQKQKNGKISTDEKHYLTLKNEYNLYRKVMLKYKIMRIRNKISYIAY